MHQPTKTQKTRSTTSNPIGSTASGNIVSSDVSDKKTETKISGCISSDFIVIHEPATSNEGVRYYGEGSERKYHSYGTSQHAEIVSGEPASKISKKQIKRRAESAMQLISAIAGGDTTDQELVISEMINLNKGLFDKLLPRAECVMTAEQAISIQSLLRLPTNKFRNLRRCLNNMDLNILPSVRKFSKIKNKWLLMLINPKLKLVQLG